MCDSSFLLDFYWDLKTTPSSALINIKRINIQDWEPVSSIYTLEEKFYTNEIAYFQCTSVYFLANFGYSWTIVFENGTESADINFFVNGTGFRSFPFSLLICKLNFTVSLIAEWSRFKYNISSSLKNSASRETRQHFNHNHEFSGIKMHPYIKGIRCRALIRESNEFLEGNLSVTVRGINNERFISGSAYMSVDNLRT